MISFFWSVASAQPASFQKEEEEEKREVAYPPSCDFLIDLCAASEFFTTRHFGWGEKEEEEGKEVIYFLRFGSIEKEYLPSNKSSGRPPLHLDQCQQLTKKEKEKRRKTSKYNSLKTKQKFNQLIKKKEEVKNDLKALPGNRRKK